MIPPAMSWQPPGAEEEARDSGRMRNRAASGPPSYLRVLGLFSQPSSWLTLGYMQVTVDQPVEGGAAERWDINDH